MRFIGVLLFAGCLATAAERPRKVVLIAGTKSHGIGAHDTQPPMPLMTGERMPILEKQMKPGCGLVLIHYSTFLTYKSAEQMLGWEGGYYEWKGPKERQSAIKTLETDVILRSRGHDVLRGVVPFKFRDEYYYKLHLQESAPGFQPILRVPALSENSSEQTVAWALQCPDVGRGFGTTTGHFFANWENDNYRRLILNAIVWTAGVSVPEGGVKSSFIGEVEVNRALMVKPVSTLLVTGASEEVSDAVISALNSEIPRFQVTTTTVSALGQQDLSKYKLVVLRHCGSGGDEAAAAKLKYLRLSGALVTIDCGVSVTGITPRTAPPATFKVVISDVNHPVVHNVSSYETTDEISVLPLTDKEAHVVAIAGSAPVAVVSERGTERIFHLNLGHDAKAISVSGTTQLFDMAAFGRQGRWKPFNETD